MIASMHGLLNLVCRRFVLSCNRLIRVYFGVFDRLLRRRRLIQSRRLARRGRSISCIKDLLSLRRIRRLFNHRLLSRLLDRCRRRLILFDRNGCFFNRLLDDVRGILQRCVRLLSLLNLRRLPGLRDRNLARFDRCRFDCLLRLDRLLRFDDLRLFGLICCRNRLFVLRNSLTLDLRTGRLSRERLNFRFAFDHRLLNRRLYVIRHDLRLRIFCRVRDVG